LFDGILLCPEFHAEVAAQQIDPPHSQAIEELDSHVHHGGRALVAVVVGTAAVISPIEGRLLQESLSGKILVTVVMPFA
jgi:hypothetical protein